MATTPAHRRIRSTAAWQRLAKQAIAEEPACWLRLPGCTGRSNTGDHVIPVCVRPDLALVRSNVRGACKSCNDLRRDTPVNQLHLLRCRTRDIAYRRSQARRSKHSKHNKPAKALALFHPNKGQATYPAGAPHIPAGGMQ